MAWMLHITPSCSTSDFTSRTPTVKPTNHHLHMEPTSAKNSSVLLSPLYRLTHELFAPFFYTNLFRLLQGRLTFSPISRTFDKIDITVYKHCMNHNPCKYNKI